MSDPAILLFCLVLFPAAGGLVVMVLPEIRARVREAAAAAFGGLTAICASRLTYLVFAEGAAGSGRYVPFAPLPQVSCRLPGGTGITLPLGFFLDSLSVLTVLAVSWLGILCIVYAIEGLRRGARGSEFYGYALWAVAAANLAALSDNTVVMLAGWSMAGPLLFLAAGNSGGGSRDGIWRSLTGPGASSIALMLGFMILGALGGAGGLSLSRMVPTKALPLAADELLWTAAAVCVVVAALIRLGAMPGHGWAVECSAAGGQPVGAMMPAGLDRLLGTYLVVRVGFCLFDWQGAEGLRTVLLAVGAVGAVCGAAGAMVQTDLRKMLAFHGVGQSGLVLAAAAAGSSLGMAGALLQGLAAALAMSLLFLCAGSIERRTGTGELAKLGGLGRRMPLTFLAMFVAGMSAAGLPLLAGYTPRWLTCLALLNAGFGPESQPYGGLFGLACLLSVVAILAASLLTALSFLRLFRAVCTGPATPCCQAARPVGPAVRFSVYVMTLLLLAAGLFPGALCGPGGLIGRVIADGGGSPVAPQASLLGIWPAAGGFWNAPVAGVLLLVAASAGGLVMAVRRIARSRTVDPFTALPAVGEDLGAIAYPTPDFGDVIGEVAVLRGLKAVARLRPLDLGHWLGRFAENLGLSLSVLLGGWLGVVLSALTGAAAVAGGVGLAAGLPIPTWTVNTAAAVGAMALVAGALGACGQRRAGRTVTGLWIASAGLALLALTGAVRAGDLADTALTEHMNVGKRIANVRVELSQGRAMLGLLRDGIAEEEDAETPPEYVLADRIADSEARLAEDERRCAGLRRLETFARYGRSLLLLGFALSLAGAAAACVLLRLWAGMVGAEAGGSDPGAAGGLWLRMPVSSACAAVGSLSFALMAPTVGFWTLLTMLAGLLLSRQYGIALVACVGTLAAIQAVAGMAGGSLFGQMSEEVIRSRGERRAFSVLAQLVLAGICLLLALAGFLFLADAVMPVAAWLRGL